MNHDLVCAHALSEPTGKALCNEDGAVLAACAPEGKFDATAAPAAEVCDYRVDLSLEHFKELIETAASGDKLFHGIVGPVQRRDFFHQWPRIRQETNVED